MIFFKSLQMWSIKNKLFEKNIRKRSQVLLGEKADILAILALAAILRLILLNQSLWLDEAIQIQAVKNFSYLNLVTVYSLGDFHPPLYHLTLKLWTWAFGFSEISARLPSVIFGVATVFVVYLIGEKLFSKTAGLAAALFLAVAPLHIYYSQEARMYSQAAFLTGAAVYFFLRLFDRPAKNWPFLVWLISTILLFYTDYLPWLMLVPFNIYVFLNRRSLAKNWIRNWFLVHFLLLVFLAPWLPFFYQQLQIGLQTAAASPLWGAVVGGFSLKAILITFAKFISGRISSYNEYIYDSFILLAGFWFFILGSFATLIASRKNLFLLLWLIVPNLLAWLISPIIPIYVYFRMLFILPAAYLILGEGVAEINQSRARVGVIFSILLIGLGSWVVFVANDRFHRENWRQAVSFIEQNSPDNALTVFVNIAQTAPYQYYSSKVPYTGGDSWKEQNPQTIWLMRYVQPIFDPADSVRQSIEAADFAKMSEYDFNGVTVARYIKRSWRRINP